MRFIVALLLSVLAFAGCSNSSSDEAKTSAVVAGTYTDSRDTTRVVVTEDSIEVYINGDDQDYLYWAGTWSKGDTVVSKPESKRLEESWLGSEESTMTFHVGDNEIKFTANLMDMTREVVVTK